MGPPQHREREKLQERISGSPERSRKRECKMWERDVQMCIRDSPYDTYTVNELPCAANAGQVLVKDLSVTVSRDSHCLLYTSRCV